MATPQALLRYRPRILACDPDSQAIRYVARAWDGARDGRIFFRDDTDFLHLTRRFPNAISRANIKELSQDVMARDKRSDDPSPYDPIGLRRIFLATLLWGYGSRDNRGPWKAHTMLTDPNVAGMLEMAASCIACGRAAEAYNKFKVRQCGPAYFSKLFYFLGLGVAADPLPLILDNRVKHSLRVLIGDIEASRFERGAAGYVRYVEAMTQWAQDLGCRPDAVELFLFKGLSQA